MAEVVFGEVRFLPPERIDFSQDAGHTRVRRMDAGEITQHFPPGQKEISISGFFPAEADRYGGCSGAEEAAGKKSSFLPTATQGNTRLIFLMDSKETIRMGITYRFV